MYICACVCVRVCACNCVCVCVCVYAPEHYQQHAWPRCSAPQRIVAALQRLHASQLRLLFRTIPPPAHTHKKITHTHTCTYILVCTCRHINAYVCTHAYMHTRKHMYTHTRIFTYIQTCNTDIHTRKQENTYLHMSLHYTSRPHTLTHSHEFPHTKSKNAHSKVSAHVRANRAIAHAHTFSPTHQHTLSPTKSQSAHSEVRHT